jgi:hypothetical protein
MVQAVARLIAAGHIQSVDPVAAAGQFLSATHGYALLEIGGFFGQEGNGFAWIFAPMALSIVIGLGASREAAEAAGVIALERKNGR